MARQSGLVVRASLRAESLKNSTQYWEHLKNRLVVEVLDFIKYVFNLDIFNWEPKKMALYLQVLGDSMFFLEIFPTHFTMHCPKCLFHMDNHIDQVGNVMFVEIISR